MSIYPKDLPGCKTHLLIKPTVPANETNSPPIVTQTFALLSSLEPQTSLSARGGCQTTARDERPPPTIKPPLRSVVVVLETHLQIHAGHPVSRSKQEGPMNPDESPLNLDVAQRGPQAGQVLEERQVVCPEGPWLAHHHDALDLVGVDLLRQGRMLVKQVSRHAVAFQVLAGGEVQWHFVVQSFAGEAEAGAVGREVCLELSLGAPVLHSSIGAGVRVDGVAQLGGETEQRRVLLVLEGTVDY